MFNWPYLAKDSGGNITVVRSNESPLWFDLSGSSYIGRFGTKSVLTHDAVTNLFVLTLPTGDVLEFQDFTQTTNPQGLFYRQTAPGGSSTDVITYSATRITEIQRTGTVNGNTLTEAFVYAYNGDDRLTSVKLRRQLGTSGWEDVRQAVYEYYGSGDSFGSLGDLKRVRLQAPISTGWTDVAVSDYRYYLNGDTYGSAHLLKYIVEPATYAKMVATSIDPLTASNAVLSTYADNYFQFDTMTDAVTLESVRGGSETFEYAYTAGTSGGTSNQWSTKTVETLPNGDTNTVYANSLGQPLIKDLASGTDHWIEAWHYDSNSRQLWYAHPSAVVSYNDTYPDLAIQLETSSGLIDNTNYYSTTGGGAAEGYVSSITQQQGSSGTPVAIMAYEYTSQTAGGSTVYPISKQTLYRNDDGTGGIDTTYSYTYYTATTQIQQKTTTLPVVSTGQNGSGTAATRKEYFDENGRVTWAMDERGFITKFTYDLATGAVLQRIRDVDTSVVSGAPSGWSTPTGGGLNLVTDYEIDDLGRTTQSLGPSHSVDLGCTATTIRQAEWFVYDNTNYIVYAGRGYATGTSPSYSFTLVNPVSISKQDAGGRLLEAIQAISSSTSGTLADIITAAGSGAAAFPQSSYSRWTTYEYTDCCLLASERKYHTIPASGSGSSGTNYDETDYGYDVMKWPNRTVTPGGTITDLVYDPRGLVLGTYVGTNDDGATPTDPTGGGSNPSNNMVIVTANVYDGGSAARFGQRQRSGRLFL